MTTGIMQEQNLEKHIQKQMGCLAGFLQIFDRHQLVAGKRIYSAKRLPPSSASDSSLEPEKYNGSPAVSRELEKRQPRSTPSPDRVKQNPPRELQSPVSETITPAESQAKIPLPRPVFESKAWKFSREAPRLSLDSRAVTDAKGGLHPREVRTNTTMLSINRCENPGDGADSDIEKQRKSTSVIARLMGLEPLPGSDPEPEKKAELRRSASESRVSRDMLQYRFFDINNFQLRQLQQQSNAQGHISSTVVRAKAAAVYNRISNSRPTDSKEFVVQNSKTEAAKALHKGIGQKKSFYDSADIFPEPKHTISICGETEKRLKIRGNDELSTDLETLKHIHEALQLKGLLHSKKPTGTGQRNYVFDGTISGNESPIVVMKLARSPASFNRTGTDSPPSSFRSSPRARRNLSLGNDTLPTASPGRGRPEIDRNIRNLNRVRNSISPSRSESSINSPNRRRLVNDSGSVADQRWVSPVHSPKVSSRWNVSDQQGASRSPRMRKPTVKIYHKEDKLLARPPTEDESSTISESSISIHAERAKLEESKEGRGLLERCDKLLHSIAEMTATELQPSPVSVLDSSFYKDESSSPSPDMKRCIDYKDHDIWSATMSSIEETSEDCDFVYVSEILRASSYLPEDSDIFLLLEKQQHLKGKETSKASTLERRLIFDTIHEILNRNRLLPPWKAIGWASSNTTPLLERIWSEFRRIRERDESEELFEVICGVLKKDLAEDAMNEWGECPIEMGDAVLDIERLIFKDLISETIRDLASFPGPCSKVAALRRKLLF